MLSHSRAKSHYLERFVPHSIPDERDGDQELPRYRQYLLSRRPVSIPKTPPQPRRTLFSYFLPKYKLSVPLQVMLDLQEKGTVGGLVSLQKRI